MGLESAIRRRIERRQMARTVPELAHGAETVDPVRYPLTHTYLTALPRGLESYPECRTRGSVVRAALAELAAPLPPGGLPERVRALYDEPPEDGAWIAQVLANAALLTMVDALGLGAEGHRDWSYRTAYRVCQCPLYAFLCRAATPGLLLRGMAFRWPAMQEGTSLEVAAVEAREAALVLRHPPGLHPPAAHRHYGVAFEVVAELARGQDVACEVVESHLRGASYRLTWG